MIKVIIEENGVLVKEMIITEQDCKALQNDILDIADWILPEITDNAKGNNGFRGGAITQKIHACRKRFIEPYKTVGDVRTDDELIDFITTLPDYKNRATRDAEAKVQLELEDAARTEAARLKAIDVQLELDAQALANQKAIDDAVALAIK